MRCVQMVHEMCSKQCKKQWQIYMIYKGLKSTTMLCMRLGWLDLTAAASAATCLGLGSFSPCRSLGCHFLLVTCQPLDLELVILFVVPVWHVERHEFQIALAQKGTQPPSKPATWHSSGVSSPVLRHIIKPLKACRDAFKGLIPSRKRAVECTCRDRLQRGTQVWVPPPEAHRGGMFWGNEPLAQR